MTHVGGLSKERTEASNEYKHGSVHPTETRFIQKDKFVHIIIKTRMRSGMNQQEEAEVEEERIPSLIQRAGVSNFGKIGVGNTGMEEWLPVGAGVVEGRSSSVRAEEVGEEQRNTPLKPGGSSIPAAARKLAVADTAAARTPAAAENSTMSD